MSKIYNVAVLVGSLRKESLNRKMAKVLMEVAPPSLKCAFVEIGDLPLYNEDADAAPIASWTKFRNEINPVDAILFVTPEYNRSVPAALKNALDVGSRPYGQSVWNGKPSAIVSVSSGAVGGFGANHHLRQSLVFLNTPPMQQPEAYIGHANTLFDDAGKMANESTRSFMTTFMAAFSAWIAANAKA